MLTWCTPYGDWTAYRVRACNTLSGLSNTAGSGCSGYTASSGRIWQKPAAPTCSIVSTTWNSVTAKNVRSTKVGAKGYVNPDSAVKVQLRKVSGDVRKNAVSQSKGVTSSRSETWTDLSPSSLTIKPETSYSFDTRIWNVAGWSDWGANCTGKTKKPPVPSAPVMSSSKNNANRSITWSWTKPTNANLFWTTGAFIENSTTNRVRTLTGQPYAQDRCVRVRAAYNARLAGWGYMSGWSNNSCQRLVNPTPPLPPASTSCMQFAGHARVRDALTSARNQSVQWRLVSGYNATSATLISGTIEDSTLVCVFYRDDEYFDDWDGTWKRGSFGRLQARVAPLSGSVAV